MLFMILNRVSVMVNISAGAACNSSWIIVPGSFNNEKNKNLSFVNFLPLEN